VFILDQPAGGVYQVFMVIRQNERMLLFLSGKLLVELFLGGAGSQLPPALVEVVGLALHGARFGDRGQLIGANRRRGLAFAAGLGKYRPQVPAGVGPEVDLGPALARADGLVDAEKYLTMNVLFAGQGVQQLLARS
jgi:hypothetical protein